jgi:hypothetical protein
VHRDLKPANVLLAGDGRAIVADFGIAGITGDHAGDIAGTTGYMAPEQQTGGEIDARADVYAFGTMLCQMLSGALPAGDVAHQLAGEPAEVIALVRACLAPAPADRPADGAALVAGLAAVTASRRRRRRARLAAGVVAGIAGAVVVAMATPARSIDDVPRSPRYALAGFAGAPDGLDASFRARLRDELIDAWGVEDARDGGADPDTVAVAGKLARTAGGLRASTGGIAVDAPELDELAAAVARAVVLRDVPAGLRRPTAGDLIAAGTTDAEAWRAWRRGQRQALLQHWYRASELCSGALRRDPGFALAALELALSYDSGDRLQGPALSRAFELAARRPLAPIWQHAFAAVAATGKTDEAAAEAEVAAARGAAADDRDRLYIDARWAIGLLVTGREDRAAPLLEVIRERRPDDAAAWIALTDYYAMSDEPDAVELTLRDSEVALRLAPDERAVRAERALALVRTGDPDGARREIERAQGGPPDQRGTVRATMFNYRMAIGDIAEATADARRMLGGNARLRVSGKASLARIDLYHGLLDDGLAALAAAADDWDALGMSVAAAAARLEVARQAHHAGRDDLARPMLARVAGGTTHYRGPATVLRRLIDDGPASARAALAGLPPDAAAGRELLLAIADATHDWPAVLAGYQRMRGARAPSAMYFAARALTRSHRTAEAIELYTALVHHPDAWHEPVLGADAWHQLGDLQCAQGQRAAAREAYASYLARQTAPIATPDVRRIRAWLADPAQPSSCPDSTVH